MDLNIYKVDLDTDQPNGGKGESPRSAFTKYNNSLDTINGELTTLGESVDTISGELTTLGDRAAQKSANLSDLTDAATARNNLGLGSAATKNVGTSIGNVMEVGAFGIGGQGGQDNVPAGYPTSSAQNITQAYRRNEPDNGVREFSASWHFAASTCWGRLRVKYDSPRAWIQGGYAPNGQGWTAELYHTGNTTVDGNGFIKRASPIIKLFSNSIEKTEHLEIGEVELERVDVGHYVLRNTPLLSRDGWYIETPKDRNNNIYFYLDYEENETDKTLTIKTYKPDYSTGRAEAGDPVDILEGRFVSLRFEEDTSLYVEQEISND